jgi:hypothetical protein
MEVVDEEFFFAKERKNHSDCYSSIYIRSPCLSFPEQFKGFSSQRAAGPAGPASSNCRKRAKGNG